MKYFLLKYLQSLCKIIRSNGRLIRIFKIISDTRYYAEQESVPIKFRYSNGCVEKFSIKIIQFFIIYAE